MKAYRNTGASLQSSQYADLAMKTASSMGEARTLGLGAYFTARREARAILENLDVPSLLWGVYYAFVNEFVHKVQQTHAMTADDLMSKYTDAGLDRTVLSQVVDTISAVVKTTTQRPAPSK